MVESREQRAQAFGSPYDARAICNLILDRAERQGSVVTNLALQKLLYFVHGIFLLECKRPLVSGYFEAWQFGPVHPAAYRAFKNAGDAPIAFRAIRQAPLWGPVELVPEPNDADVVRCCDRVASTYARMTPGRLVEISHASGAPWHFIVNKARTSTAFGLRIPDEVIVERFKFHKVSIGAEPKRGEPREDTPFA